MFALVRTLFSCKGCDFVANKQWCQILNLNQIGGELWDGRCDHVGDGFGKEDL